MLVRSTEYLVADRPFRKRIRHQVFDIFANRYMIANQRFGSVVRNELDCLVANIVLKEALPATVFAVKVTANVRIQHVYGLSNDGDVYHEVLK